MRVVASGCCAIVAVFLSGCVKPIDRLTYAAKREIIVGSKAAYLESVRLCVKTLSGHSAEARRLLELSKASPQVTCERYMSARREGRLTYEHYLSRVKGDEPEELVRVLQGR